MKRFSVFLLALPLIFFTIGTANALQLDAVDGDWSNVTGGAFTAPVNFDSGIGVVYGNGLQDQVHWGEGIPNAADQSGLGFTGIVGLSPDSVTFALDEAFQLGQLVHFNNVVRIPTASAVDLTVNLLFSDPAALSGPYTFDLFIEETPNACDTPDCSDDIIGFPDSFPDQSVMVAPGMVWTLELLGFTEFMDPIDETANPLIRDFVSPEGGDNQAFLWARVTESPAGVPEPATLLLVGSGLLGLAGYGRKKLLKK